MLDYFLLTYSVNKVGTTQQAKDISDSVRLDIGKLKKRENLESWNEDLADPFVDWEKLDGLETAIKGLIRVQGESNSEKERDITRKFNFIFRQILKENNAKSSTTIIKCACMIESVGTTTEFEITNN